MIDVYRYYWGVYLLEDEDFSLINIKTNQKNKIYSQILLL